jgi:hypothetical protein
MINVDSRSPLASFGLSPDGKYGKIPAMPSKLPRSMKPLFWEYDFARLTWDADRDLIVGRILSAGNWDSLRWLRRRLPDGELRIWLEHRHGAGLSNRQLRFWELLLALPHRQVNSWLAQPGRRIWEDRNRE